MFVSILTVTGDEFVWVYFFRKVMQLFYRGYENIRVLLQIMVLRRGAGFHRSDHKKIRVTARHASAT